MTDTITPEEYRAMGRQSRSRKLGQFGEDLIRRSLERAYLCVERVHTPFRIHRDARGRVRNATPVEKVSGDFRAVGRGGQSILVEVKTRSGQLRWSDLADHQRRGLNDHSDAGGLSLLAWYDPDSGEVRIYEWPVPGFGPRQTLGAHVHSKTLG